MPRQQALKLFPALAALISAIALLQVASRLPEQVFFHGPEGLAGAPRFSTLAAMVFILYGAFYLASCATLGGRRWGAWLYWVAVAASFAAAFATGGISRLGGMDWFLFALAPFTTFTARSTAGRGTVPDAEHSAWTPWSVIGLLVGAVYLAFAIAFSALAHPATTAGGVLFALAVFAAAAVAVGSSPFRVAAAGAIGVGIVLGILACLAGFQVESLLADPRPLYESLWLLVAPGFLRELGNGMPIDVALVEFTTRALIGAAAALIIAVPLQLRLYPAGSPSTASARPVAAARPALVILVIIALGAPIILELAAPASTSDPAPDIARTAPQAEPDPVVAPPPAATGRVEEQFPIEGAEEGEYVDPLSVAIGPEAPPATETVAMACPLNEGCGSEPTVRRTMNELQLQAISIIQPVVPESLRGVKGTVMADIVIGLHGRVIAEEVEVTGTPEFLDLVQDSVGQWVFKPYRVDGQPARVATTVPFIFGGRNP
jgi:hypothetical protein